MTLNAKSNNCAMWLS